MTKNVEDIEKCNSTPFREIKFYDPGLIDSLRQDKNEEYEALCQVKNSLKYWETSFKNNVNNLSHFHSEPMRKTFIDDAIVCHVNKTALEAILTEMGYSEND